MVEQRDLDGRVRTQRFAQQLRDALARGVRIRIGALPARGVARTLARQLGDAVEAAVRGEGRAAG